MARAVTDRTHANTAPNHDVRAWNNVMDAGGDDLYVRNNVRDGATVARNAWRQAKIDITF